MRDLIRNKRELWYCAPLETRPILDEYGNDTLEVETTYSVPLMVRANVSANIGQEAVETFGTQTEYNRTVCITALSCPLTKGCLVWFGVPVTEAANYIVVGVADSKNGFLVALREVTPGV